LIASGADGYSLTKHDAELLVWQASERGLPVQVVRIPHILTTYQPSRLSYIASAWAAAGVMPEGPWHWQFVDPHEIAEALQSIATKIHSNATSLVTHVTLPPVSSEEVHAVLKSLGHLTCSRTMPACANALSNGGALTPLMSRYGPAATMCVNEPVLESCSQSAQDAPAYLKSYLEKVMSRSNYAKLQDKEKVRQVQQT